MDMQYFKLYTKLKNTRFTLLLDIRLWLIYFHYLRKKCSFVP